MNFPDRKIIPSCGGILAFLTGIALFISCHNGNSAMDENVEKGKALAEKYCQSCHLLPDPAMADKRSWMQGILPNMGPRLGIFYFRGQTYPSRMMDPNVGRSFYPAQPVLTEEEWAQLLTYYNAVAPDSLPEQDRKTPLRDSTPLFMAVKPAFHYPNPVSTFLSIDTLSSPRRIIQAEALLHNIYFYNDKLQVTDSLHGNGMFVDILSGKDSMVLCNIGVINPNDGRFGSIEQLKLNGKSKQKEIQPMILADSLRRPVQITPVDLNGDKLTDYIVCEFGNTFGALSWLENTGKGKYIRHVLRAEPGAINAIVNDYNHDGLPDIWVLFAQGDESIVLFTNKGNGHFEQRQVLRFPPIYGSSHFELADFNGDGYADILYTCGDNADYSQILKPYHGVYIFLNDGNQHFHQVYFYPIHGCYKALARDFDGDGDLDIAAISFFADYKGNPQEGFVYLENKGNWNFDAYAVPEAQTGRWLTMDAGDLDGDGRQDIVLGNFSVGPTLGKSHFNWKTGPAILLLKNTGKK